MADSDTPALDGYVRLDHDRLICRRCGALVFRMLDIGDGARLPEYAHDEFHALVDGLLSAAASRDDLAAEQRERTDG